jgi:hypothetical protein
MEKFLKKPRLNSTALVLATALAVNVPLGFGTLIQAASAQTTNSSTLADSTIKALQEALWTEISRCTVTPRWTRSSTREAAHG